ncbi:hypothetical protein DL93DRAFT_2093351 [Clavulina sp. PMI_390]|nr:hypothetical protein DL93DRAFT_2093351 [Clavulina sp. PMI_390]
MLFQSMAALLITLATTPFVAADFHYGTLQCSEAGGGYIDAGFILNAASADYCVAAFNADKPGSNIPINSTHPTATVCGRNVTINVNTLEWFATDSGGVKNKKNHGTCTRTDDDTTTCNPTLAECTYTNLLNCVSSVCDES